MFGDVRVVDRVAASIASLPRLRFDGSMMKRHDDSQRGDRLAVTFGDGDPHESLTARRAYASVPRLGSDGSVMKRHDDSQRIDGLAVTQRGGSRLTRIWAGLYTRPRMGTDSIQPSRRLPTTDYRLPTPTSRSADHAAADRPAPVLSAAPSIRVAHSRHASVRPAADPVGRHFHQSRPTCVATLAGRHHAWRAQACPFGAARGRQRRYGLED